MNQKSPTLSIAMATYNGGTFLEEQLRSLQKQTLPVQEIVVCDDGSTDTTWALLQQYASRLPLRLYRNEQSLGVVANFRKAVSLCQGDYIAFCDQDDVWFPEKLQRTTERLQAIDGPAPALVFTDLAVVDESLHPMMASYWAFRKLNPAKETFGSLLYGNFVTGCTMLINRPMAEEVRQMPDGVMMHDFWITCIAYGLGRYDWIAEPTLLYRQHRSNVTNNTAVTIWSKLAGLMRLLTDPEQATVALQAAGQQAVLFQRQYQHRLPPKNQKILARFVGLQSTPLLYRKGREVLAKFRL